MLLDNWLKTISNLCYVGWSVLLRVSQRHVSASNIFGPRFCSHATFYLNVWRLHLTFFLLCCWLKTGFCLLAFSKRVYACWLLIDALFSKWAIVILQPTTKSQKRFSFKLHTFMHDCWYSVNYWFMSRVTVVMKEPLTLLDHEHALYHLPPLYGK